MTSQENTVTPNLPVADLRSQSSSLDTFWMFCDKTLVKAMSLLLIYEGELFTLHRSAFFYVLLRIYQAHIILHSENRFCLSNYI